MNDLFHMSVLIAIVFGAALFVIVRKRYKQLSQPRAFVREQLSFLGRGFVCGVLYLVLAGISIILASDVSQLSSQAILLFGGAIVMTVVVPIILTYTRLQ